MMNEAASTESNAKDEVSARVPVPREPDEPEGTSSSTGEGSVEVSSGAPGGGTADGSDGIAYIENAGTADAPTHGDTPDVEGLNTAAGPAEEEDTKEDDDRALTTDISPSD
jgi:hypothetical protein